MNPQETDREFAWRHAFAYADGHVSTDDAIAYARHYVTLLTENDMADWPPHSRTFRQWCVENDI
jgi:prepilin-type processing-associated H-X9-DG protein